MQPDDPEHLAFFEQRSALKAAHAGAIVRLHDALARERSLLPFADLSEADQSKIAEDALLLCVTCDDDGGTHAVKADAAVRAIVAEQYRIGREIAELESRMISAIGPARKREA